MSDVLSDARDQFDDYLNSLLREDDLELQRLRYIWGAEARAGDTAHAIPIVSTIDWVRAGQPDPIWLADAGYDDGSWLADALNREAEEQMLGRPLFPNEY